ncbi:17893_t:CDS:2 [Gigaspora margarita]|uniref:17893_t:CDS:1 n=1 Tax=Gigaspora margarita TaxID=4874 RepID=A0ABM8W3N0_GIGMA|nr:17893_t:CDS:2 [Gigaspora margarita]
MSGVGKNNRGAQSPIQAPCAALQPSITRGVPTPTVTVPLNK